MPIHWVQAVLASILVLLAACRNAEPSTSDGCVDGADDASDVPSGMTIDELPAGFPRPRVPVDEPVTKERVELGRHLFYDSRLSVNEAQSCSSCHLQALAFTDGRVTGLGATGESHFRNAPSLTNVAYRSVLLWANPIQDSLAEQALIPLFGQTPIELGLSGMEDVLFARLRAEPRYASLFAAAFPGTDDPVTLGNIVKALAAFQRTILSYRSPFDRYTYGGEQDAISPSAKRGVDLFFDERFECFHCHGGFDFTDSTVHAQSGFVETAFHNTAVYNIGDTGAYPAIDRGLIDATDAPGDMGRFRAPTLRNVEVTAPYFHDGSAATLDDVLDHYARGGRITATGPNAGDGAQSPLRSEFVIGIDMTVEERADLLAFLRSLTDRAMLEDPRLASPWSAPP
jgi:cytochrome c peroxidase